MKAKYEIKTKNTNMGTKAVRLSICSKCMVDDIIKLGIGPRKSLTLKFPKIPKKYIHHFIRGYFDGDGYIDIRKTKTSQYNQLRLSMLGTKDFLMHIKTIFSDFYGEDIGSIEDCGKYYNAHRLTFSGTKSAVTFAKYIYNNSQNKNRLTRKYRTYKKYKK